MSKLNGAVSHHGREVAELAADPDLAAACLKAAIEDLDNPEHREAGLLALWTVAEAYGGPATIADEAGSGPGRLVRVARVLAEAEATFGSREIAGAWLCRPTTALGGGRPLLLLDTDDGARKVSQLLGAIGHGIAA